MRTKHREHDYPPNPTMNTQTKTKRVSLVQKTDPRHCEKQQHSTNSSLGCVFLGWDVWLANLDL